MGRGMVEPLDMMDNEPWSQDLLDWLAFNFTQQGNYDLKELIIHHRDLENIPVAFIRVCGSIEIDFRRLQIYMNGQKKNDRRTIFGRCR